MEMVIGVWQTHDQKRAIEISTTVGELFRYRQTIEPAILLPATLAFRCQSF